VHYCDVQDPYFGKFWPPDVQLMAKDILKFHAVIWPALLLALGVPLPKLIFVHGYFTIDGQKMSKTVGNVIDPLKIAKKFGVDPLRYFLLREFAFGEDGDFSEKRLAERYEFDLANDLGNLVQRVLVLTEKKFQGKVPEPALRSSNLETAYVLETWKAYDLALENLQFEKALDEIWKLVNFANQRIDEKNLGRLKLKRLKQKEQGKYFLEN